MNQTNQGQTRPGQGQVSQGQTTINNSSENEVEGSSFNMHEMKLTLDNLVKVVYNLKSLTDFPEVNQTNQSS